MSHKSQLVIKNIIYMFTDPIADYLTRIRNANLASHRIVEILLRKLKKISPKFFLIKVIF